MKQHRNPGQEDATAAMPRGVETILLAEDEPAVRGLTARILRVCGYTVLEAADGAEAVQVARSHAPQPIHLLLLDVVMPQLGGPAAATAIRHLYPAVAVLFVSGYTGLATAPEGIAPEDLALLHKPFTPAALATAVRAAIDRRASEALG